MDSFVSTYLWPALIMIGDHDDARSITFVIGPLIMVHRSG